MGWLDDMMGWTARNEAEKRLASQEDATVDRANNFDELKQQRALNESAANANTEQARALGANAAKAAKLGNVGNQQSVAQNSLIAQQQKTALADRAMGASSQTFNRAQQEADRRGAMVSGVLEGAGRLGAGILTGGASEAAFGALGALTKK